MEGFFNEDIYIKCPLVLFRGILKVVDEVEQALGFDGAVWFITDVEFRELHGPGRHSTEKVRLLEDFLVG